jgi:L-histidine Nalpha-methyltransferase
MSGANVFIHESQFPDALRRELLRSFRTRRINHKFHYESHKQAQKWLAVHEAHSPARIDRECRRIYDDAFAETAKIFADKPVRVVGLGCGGGQKDARLIELLSRSGERVSYAPVDVSVPLVLVARGRVLKFLSAEKIAPLCCDLALADDVSALLNASRGEQRLITFFGMIPNFEPQMILPRLAATVRSSDTLLFSANLVPGDPAQSMRSILPQYDNEATREWLLTLLLDLGVERRNGELTFSIERVNGRVPLWRFIAHFVFRRLCSIRIGSEEMRFRRGEKIQVFFSYRHTPRTIERLLNARGLHVAQSWITPSGEEGVFRCVRS